MKNWMAKQRCGKMFDASLIGYTFVDNSIGINVMQINLFQ